MRSGAVDTWGPICVPQNLGDQVSVGPFLSGLFRNGFTKTLEPGVFHKPFLLTPYPPICYFLLAEAHEELVTACPQPCTEGWVILLPGNMSGEMN
jgi:hypothetical protein